MKFSLGSCISNSIASLNEVLYTELLSTLLIAIPEINFFSFLQKVREDGDMHISIFSLLFVRENKTLLTF